MPARKPDVPERKACYGNKKRVADVTKGPTMMTRSMQREKEKGQNLCDLVKSLPKLSGILIQAINLCKSAKGLSFTELKGVLGAKGYDVSRYCPSIKKQLKSLASKGALVRVTHKVGCSYFVIRKHQGKEVTTQASEGSEKILRAKTRAERTNSQRAPEKMKGTTAQPKSSGLKAAEASRTVQRPNRKWKPGEKQPGQPPSQSSSAKTFQRPTKKTLFSVKRPNNFATNTGPATKGPCYSSSKPASSRKAVRYSRSTTANEAKKSGSPINQAGSKRSRCSSNDVAVSEKRLGSLDHHTTHSVKTSEYSRSKSPPSGKRERRLRGKALFRSPGSKSSRATPNTKRPRII